MSKTKKADTAQTGYPKQSKARDNKYRVIPNLSLKGKEVMMRLKNRSLILQSQNNYSLEEELDNARRMTKLDIKLAAMKNKEKINQLQTQLNNG